MSSTADSRTGGRFRQSSGFARSSGGSEAFWVYGIGLGPPGILSNVSSQMTNFREVPRWPPGVDARVYGTGGREAQVERIDFNLDGSMQLKGLLLWKKTGPWGHWECPFSWARDGIIEGWFS